MNDWMARARGAPACPSHTMHTSDTSTGPNAALYDTRNKQCVCERSHELAMQAESDAKRGGQLEKGRRCGIKLDVTRSSVYRTYQSCICKAKLSIHLVYGVSKVRRAICQFSRKMQRTNELYRLIHVIPTFSLHF